MKPLGNDVTKCHEELLKAIDEGTVDSDGNVDADYEYHARQLVRTIFAFIEGVTFSMKVKAASHCLDNRIEITDGERFFAVDKDHILTDKGRVIERPAHIRLSDNVQLALRYKKKRFASLSLLIHLVSGGHASNLQLKCATGLHILRCPKILTFPEMKL